jgi:uncharacterized membrane protein
MIADTVRTRASAVAVIIVSLLVANAKAGDLPAYSVDFLGTGYPTAVNEFGDAVGWTIVDSAQRAWVKRTDGAFDLLPLPSDTLKSRANDINDAGIIVGSAWSDGIDGPGRAVAWYPAGGGYVTVDLGTLPDHPQSAATAINNPGDIVGYSVIPGWSGGPAVLFTADGVTDLGALGFQARPRDINDNRQVVGGSLRMDLATNLVEDLGRPDGSRDTILYAINGLGQAAGTAILATSTDDDHAVARFSDGAGWEVLSGSGPYNFGYGINDQGDVSVEASLFCASSGMTVFTGAVHVDDHGLFCLDDLLAADARDWTITTAFDNDINNARQVVAVGWNAVTGQNGAVLLSPTDLLSVATAPVDLLAQPHESTLEQPWIAIALSWTDTGTTETGFTIARRADGEAAFADIATVGQNVQSYWDTDVAPGVTYDYTVRATSVAGDSPPSNVATATAPSGAVDTEPPVATILDPANGADVSGDVQISFEATDNKALSLVEIRTVVKSKTVVICSRSVDGATSYASMCKWRTRKLATDSYPLIIYAADGTGNHSTMRITVNLVGDGGSGGGKGMGGGKGGGKLS